MPVFEFDAENKCFRRPAEEAGEPLQTMTSSSGKSRRRRTSRRRAPWRRLFWLLFILIAVLWARSVLRNPSSWPSPFQAQPRRPPEAPFDKDELGLSRRP